MPASDSEAKGLGIEYDFEYDWEYEKDPGREHPLSPLCQTQKVLASGQAFSGDRLRFGRQCGPMRCSDRLPFGKKRQ